MRIRVGKIFVAAVVLFVVAIMSQTAQAQIVGNIHGTVNVDSLRHEIDEQPYFGLYKDNYFTVGTTVGHRPNRENSNAKFQISVAQRLTKSVLPYNSYLFLFYTQKVFWNVFQESLPMTDLNFNPGIGLAKPLLVKDRFIGKCMLLLEHESNGRDGDESRSWNKLSFGASVMIDPTFIVHGKAWIPIIDGENNKDILDYCGIYQIGTSYQSFNHKWGASVVLNKRRGWRSNYNVTLEVSYRLFKRDNQYLFMQYYNGYGEGLLAYKEHHSTLRVGIVIKPNLFSDY